MGRSGFLLDPATVSGTEPRRWEYEDSDRLCSVCGAGGIVVALAEELARVRAPAQSSYAAIGGQAQTRLRSPYAPSIRRTGGQYFAGRGPVPG